MISNLIYIFTVIQDHLISKSSFIQDNWMTKQATYWSLEESYLQSFVNLPYKASNILITCGYNCHSNNI